MADAQQQLQLLLSSLSERELKKLAAKVELDRGVNKLGLPHNAIMQLLRPSLALIRAPRVYTSQRAFCLPFEEMLINGRTGEKSVGKIERSMIQPMWEWFSREHGGEQLNNLSQNYIGAQKKADKEKTLEASKKLWAYGAEKITAALDIAEQDNSLLNKLVSELGGMDQFEDLREIAGCLRVASILEDVKDQLRPKPMVGLNDNEVEAVRLGYEKIVEEFPGNEMYYLLAILSRLLRSSTIFQVFNALTSKGDDSVLQTTELGIVGNIVLSELESIATDVELNIRRGSYDELAIVEQIYIFSTGFKEVTESLGITRDGEWGKRMFRGRKIISDAIDELFLEDAEQVILKVLPTKSGKRIPKLTDWPNDQDFEISERRALAFRDLYIISQNLGNQSACQNLERKMRAHFDNYVTGILKALPLAPADKVGIAKAYVNIATRLMELVLSSDEADILRRRANVAIKDL